MFKPSVNITEQIADFLEEKIVTGELKGGARIQEVKLAKELSVSRGSVREALLILERRHLIDVVPRKGAVVHSMSQQDAIEVLELLALMERRYLPTCLNNTTLLTSLMEPLNGLEAAAKASDLQASLEHRAAFYQCLLQDAPRYAKTVFASLLPSSQRVYFTLLQKTDLDLYDIARYYGALTCAMKDGSQARLEELVNACSRRIVDLCEDSLSNRGANDARYAVNQ